MSYVQLATVWEKCLGGGFSSEYGKVGELVSLPSFLEKSKMLYKLGFDGLLKEQSPKLV